MDEISQLDAFLGGKSTATNPTNDVDALNNFLGAPAPKKKLSPFMSAITGFNTGAGNLMHGLIQPILEGGYLGEGMKQRSISAAAKREREYQEAVDSDPFRAKTFNLIGGIGASLPAFLIPGFGVGGAVGKTLTQGAIQGGLLGLGQYVPEGGSRLFNGAIGASLGSAIPGAFMGVNKIADLVKKPIAQKVLAGINPDEAISAKQAAERLGINLTPAEASGSEIAGAAQGTLGRSSEGALMMQKFSQDRLGQEKAAISGLFDDIAKNPQSNDLVRETAKNIIKEKTSALQKAAAPLYEKSGKEIIPDEQLSLILENPIVKDAVSKMSKDPVYQYGLKNTPVNSIKYLDLVKRYIGQDINMGKFSGQKSQDPTQLFLNQSQNDLLKTLDKVSPDYQAARSIYSEGSVPINQIKNSNIGKIADLKDQQVKNIARTIFDPAQTDPKVLRQLRDEISSKNPDAWRSITRNWMEASLDNTPGTGSSFYNKILKSDRKFNQAIIATENIPGATQKLSDMRQTFKNLINPTTPRTGARMSATYMNTRRSESPWGVLADIGRKFAGGEYDKAAINLITSNKWDKDLKAIKNLKSPAEKGQAYARLLVNVSTVGATNTAN